MAEEHVAETETVEAPAQEAVETNTPFEGEFDPDRARRTIDNLRSREKELEQQLKSDEWFEEQLRARGYEIADDDPEPLDEPEGFEDPLDQRLSAIEQWQQNQEREWLLGQAEAHVDELAKNAGVEASPTVKQFVLLSSIHAGNGIPTHEGTEAAFREVAELLEANSKAAVDKYLKSKRAPAPPSPGSPGAPSGDFDPKDDKSRIQRMAAILNRDAA